MNGSLQVGSHVRSIVDADGALLLDLKAGKYYSLNHLGALIWSRVEDGLPLSEILEHLKVNFPNPANRLQTDFKVFVDDLEKKGLVHVHA
jgi:hypothetical protein